MDESYIKVSGQWKYLYRAVDKAGNTVDFLLRAHCDKAAAHRYFEKAIERNGEPQTITADKSGANLPALQAINADRQTPIKIRQNKYLNNIVEQDHRAIKRIIKPTMGFKDFRCARLVLPFLSRHNPPASRSFEDYAVLDECRLARGGLRGLPVAVVRAALHAIVASRCSVNGMLSCTNCLTSQSFADTPFLGAATLVWCPVPMAAGALPPRLFTSTTRRPATERLKVRATSASICSHASSEISASSRCRLFIL
ncbi:hypothetical protein OKW35_005030 [Paraburkholderia sp. MM5477-R1]